MGKGLNLLSNLEIGQARESSKSMADKKYGGRALRSSRRPESPIPFS